MEIINHYVLTATSLSKHIRKSFCLKEDLHTILLGVRKLKDKYKQCKYKQIYSIITSSHYEFALNKPRKGPRQLLQCSGDLASTLLPGFQLVNVG